MQQLADRKDMSKVVMACILFIFVYGSILRGMKQTDPLEKTAPCQGCDGWAVLHFLFFALMGFLDPHRYGVYMGLGVAWEFIETFIGQNNIKLPFLGERLRLVGDSKPTDAGNVHYDEQTWWYGRVTDIAFNAMGYMFGSYINARIYGDCPVQEKKA